MKKIGILGCGWLGFSLAKSLIGDGYEVHGPYEFEDAMTQSGFFQDTWVMQLVPPDKEDDRERG